MHTENASRPRPPILFVIRIVWGALLGSVLILLLPFYLNRPEDFHLAVNFASFLDRVKTGENVLMKVLPVMAIGNTAIAILLPKLFVKTMLGRKKRLELSDYYVPFILRLALLESVAMLGFALGVTQAWDVDLFIPFQMLAVFFFLRYVPLTEKKTRSDLNPFPDHLMKERYPENEGIDAR